MSETPAAQHVSVGGIDAHQPMGAVTGIPDSLREIAKQQEAAGAGFMGVFLRDMGREDLLAVAVAGWLEVARLTRQQSERDGG